MKKRLLVVGGHGSGEIAMSVFEDINIMSNEWILEGFLTDIKKPGESLGKYKVIGTTEETADYVNKGYHIHYALHFNAKKKSERVKKFIDLRIPIEANATGIHPKAYLNPSTKIGSGSLVLPFAATSFGAQIGDFVHIYTNGFVGHDSVASNFCTIAAHSVVGGRVLLEEGVHMGLNASIREDIQIGRYSIIGMGAVVIDNFPEFSIVGGNPARFIKKVE